MSGSDASVTRVSTAGGGGRDACAITFETTLASPDPSVVAQLTRGEILDVLSVEEPIRGVVAFRIGGPPVGAITREIVALRRCIELGNDYEGEVLRLDGGAVTVQVRRR